MIAWILGIVGVLGVGGTAAAFVFFPTVVVPAASKVVSALLGRKWSMLKSVISSFSCFIP